MNFKKKYLILCSQKGATQNLNFYFKNIIKKQTKIFKISFFNKSEINKKLATFDKKFDIFKKHASKYQFIIGSSEKKIEINVINYLTQNNIDFSFYIDSITNIKKRFKGINSVPQKIICFDKTVISELLRQVKIQKKKIDITNFNMPFQNYLKKKYSKVKKQDHNILYVSSFLGLKTEKKNIIRLLNIEKSKKIYIKIHPRDDFIKWKKEFESFKKIVVYKNKEFYNEVKIKKVFGVSTMALINYKFAGFEVSFFNNNRLKKSSFLKFLRKYKIKEYKL